MSSGTPSLDAVLPGNALPLGTLCVLYEDTFSRHYVHFHKSYLGEGIVNEHKCLVIDPDTFASKEDWLKLLPAVYKVSSATPSEASTPSSDGGLKVAWRYNNLLVEESKTTGGAGSRLEYRFDNSREMGSAFANSMSHQLNKEEYTIHLKYDAESQSLNELWERVVEAVQNNLASENDDRIFRILLPNFHMILGQNGSEAKRVQEAVKFLRNFKALLRSLNGVCLLSVDEDLLPKALIPHLTFTSDLALKLTSFKDHQELTIGDYDGTLKLLKQPRLHGLLSGLSDFDIYALRLKGKTGMVVERIHLEPEEDRAGQDENLQ